MLSCFCFFLMIIHHCFSASCDSTSYHTNVRQKLEELAQNKNYVITEGTLYISFNATYTVSNPASAYGVYLFQGSDEWKMSSSDAIIFAGCTMPKGKYFSFQHYVYDRMVNNKNTQLFADLGAAINHLVINTSSSSSPFDALSTVVLTGDKQTSIDVESVLDHSSLNILSIPSEYAYFSPGINNTIDAFAILYRMALWDNITEFIQYVNNINHLQIWRLSLPQRSNNYMPRIPYTPYVRDINCSYNEVDVYKSILNQYADDVIQYIQTSYTFKYIKTVPFTNSELPPYHYYGFECIESNINCIGETRDATYWTTLSNISYNNEYFYLVLGVNHENTKQSVYIDITMYDYVPTEGQEVVAELEGNQLNQSALILPINTDINKQYLSNLWITQVSRPKNCMNNSNDDTLLIPGFCYNQTQFKQNTFLLVTRNYLNPETKTHPNRNQVVAPIFLYFST